MEDAKRCMVPGCNKLGTKRCPVCKAVGKMFSVCSQECMDRVWRDHKACHKATPCMAEGCTKPAHKYCPVCKAAGKVFKVCSQDCLDRVWPSHRECHSVSQTCMAPGCAKPGTKKCSICKEAGKDFRVCSQSCLKKVWADHHKTHANLKLPSRENRCKVQGCLNRGVKQCPECKKAGVDFKLCSQACMDKIWITHQAMHKQRADQQPGQQIKEEEKEVLQEVSDSVLNSHVKGHRRIVSNDLQAYAQVVRMAVMDGGITPQKETLLETLRVHHKVSIDQHKQVLATISNKFPSFKGRLTKQECVICYDAEADHVMLDCMHLCLCSSCSVEFNKMTISETSSAVCPICRSEVKEIRKVFAPG